jgi:hypothetical protein
MSATNTFSIAVNDLIEKMIIPTIHEFEKSKGSTASLEEVIQVFQSKVYDNNIPVKPKRKSSKKEQPKLLVTRGEDTCSKKFSKGVRGQGFCPNKIKPGSDYCSTCDSRIHRSKLASEKKKLQITENKTSEQSATVSKEFPPYIEMVIENVKYLAEIVQQKGKANTIIGKFKVEGNEKKALTPEDIDILKTNNISCANDGLNVFAKSTASKPKNTKKGEKSKEKTKKESPQTPTPPSPSPTLATISTSLKNMTLPATLAPIAQSLIPLNQSVLDKVFEDTKKNLSNKKKTTNLLNIINTPQASMNEDTEDEDTNEDTDDEDDSDKVNFD